MRLGRESAGRLRPGCGAQADLYVTSAAAGVKPNVAHFAFGLPN